MVKAQNIESQNLVANTDLLRKLSAATGGHYYPFSEIESLQRGFRQAEGRSIIHSEESFNPLIHLKWVFVLLLALVAGEWFIRKFLGSY